MAGWPERQPIGIAWSLPVARSECSPVYLRFARFWQLPPTSPISRSDEYDEYDDADADADDADDG